MSDSARALILCGIVMGVVLLLGLGLLLVRRYYLKVLTQKPGKMDLSIEAMEELRESGQITDDEFRRLRRVSLGIIEPADEKDQSESSADDEIDDERKDAQRG